MASHASLDGDVTEPQLACGGAAAFRDSYALALVGIDADAGLNVGAMLADNAGSPSVGARLQFLAHDGSPAAAGAQSPDSVGQADTDICNAASGRVAQPPAALPQHACSEPLALILQHL